MNIEKNIEYVSIGLSALGTAVAIATQQLFYAATPLTLSLALSLSNRQKEITRANLRIASLEQTFSSQTSFAQEEFRVVQSSYKTALDQLHAELLNSQNEFNELKVKLLSIESGNSTESKVARDLEIINNSIRCLQLDFLKFRESSVVNDEQYEARINGMELDYKKIYQSTVDIDREINFIKINSNSLSEIHSRINDLDASLAYLHDLNLRFDSTIAEAVDTAVAGKDIGQLIWKAVDDSRKEHSYDLVYERGESRKIFLEALQQSQDSLILVCPWITKYAIDATVKDLILDALERGVNIYVGWGHLSDVDNERNQLSKDRLLKSKAKRWGGYNAIPDLYNLQDKYPSLMKIKILGTHEKFLVCDKKFAMLGSHNFMTSATSSNEREVGIKTSNIEIINSLINRFDEFEAMEQKFASNLN